MLDELRAQIAACLSMPGMNKTFLAHIAGIHRNSLESYESEDWNPTIQTLDRLRIGAGKILRLVK